MGIREIVTQSKVNIGAFIRSISSTILYRWILYFKSQPIVVSQKPAMVFSPHQDDETLGCGGLIALKRLQGVPVEIVFLTDGRYGRPNWISEETITDIRYSEAVNALDILGVGSSQAYFLNHLDGSLQNLSNEQRQEIVDKLVQHLQSFMPEEVYVPHRKDGHPDHEATHSLVTEAIAKSQLKVELQEYPIWMLWQNPLSSNLKQEDFTHVYRLPIANVNERKTKAIQNYRSQLPGIPRGLIGRFFLPHEIFFKN
ncbi:GlcNAc-PI de-N-acetylase [Calothrix sp. HK-06]|nr:GlcNAc-PI de-N-acetylase [Calothrix sp. HK-06]